MAALEPSPSHLRSLPASKAAPQQKFPRLLKATPQQKLPPGFPKPPILQWPCKKPETPSPKFLKNPPPYVIL